MVTSIWKKFIVPPVPFSLGQSFIREACHRKEFKRTDHLKVSHVVHRGREEENQRTVSEESAAQGGISSSQGK